MLSKNALLPGGSMSISNPMAIWSLPAEGSLAAGPGRQMRRPCRNHWQYTIIHRAAMIGIRNTSHHGETRLGITANTPPVARAAKVACQYWFSVVKNSASMQLVYCLKVIAFTPFLRCGDGQGDTSGEPASM